MDEVLAQIVAQGVGKKAHLALFVLRNLGIVILQLRMFGWKGLSVEVAEKKIQKTFVLEDWEQMKLVDL